jgi:hypothetical protein
MKYIFKALSKIILIAIYNLRYIYFNSLLKNEYSESIKLDGKKKLLIAIIDNASHTPTYIHLEFLLYLKSLNFKKNYILVLPFGKYSKVFYKKKDKFVKNGEDLRLKTILDPSFDIIENFNKNIIYFSERFDSYKFIINKKKEDLTLPKNADILSLTKVNFEESFFKKYLSVYKKTKKRVFLRSPDVFIQLAKKYINYKSSQKIVTISLKDSKYSNKRNSKILEWMKFASFLKKRGVRVVFILDITSLDKKNHIRNKIKEYENYDIFSFDMRARLAIYELSYLNFSVSSGTNVLLFNSRAKYLLFSLVNTKIKSGTGSYDLWFKHTGVAINQQIPFASSGQKIIWTEDNERFNVMVKEYLMFEKKNKK